VLTAVPAAVPRAMSTTGITDGGGIGAWAAREPKGRTSDGRSAGLDLLRAVACALVVVFHVRTVLGVSFGPLDPVIGGGDSGVYIFFALSGYLLYRPFIDRAVDLRAYAIKRAARILPGYYVALVGLTILTGSAVAITHPLPYLAIAASYSIPLRDFLGSAWTLSAEVLFYVTLPLIARAARGREVAVLGSIALVSMALAVALRVTLSPGTEWLIGAYPFVVYAFVPGMLLAVVERRFAGEFRRLASWPFAVAGAVLVALGCVPSALPVALGIGVGTPLLMGWLLQHRVPGARFLAFLGGASYAMYLWHKDLLLAFGPAGLPIAVVAAATSWTIVERPILDRGHAIVKRARAATAEAEVPFPAPVEAPAG
jgi:peptidoglycan/LPS O-acetylase OafA/YrhL